MSAKVWLGAMIAVATIAVATANHWERKRFVPVVRRSPEAPWLTKEAEAQIAGPDGRMGPLFEGVVLGGAAPSREVRSRIAEFAETNRVSIDFDVAHDTLEAVRFDVVFAGCCGYEGADVLALRFRRPEIGGGCVGGPERWVDDWAMASDDGLYTRASVRVNRFTVRWERQLTLGDLLERADGLLGAEVADVARAAGDRWREIEPHRRYLVELPYPSVGLQMERAQPTAAEIVAHAGHIVEVSFPTRSGDEGRINGMRSRWGRPRTTEDTWTWVTPDRLIVADRGTWEPMVRLRTR